MREIKFIITADKKHYKSDCEDHQIIAKRHGYNIKDIIETGIIIEHRLFVLECYNTEHRCKICNSKFILTEVNKYAEELQNWQKSREAQSRYMYRRVLDGD